jgi:hypothetical protein
MVMKTASAKSRWKRWRHGTWRRPVGQVNEEGYGVMLGGRSNTHRHRGFGGFVLKTIGGTRMEYAKRERFGGLCLKTIGGGFIGLGLKTRVEVPRRNGRHVAASGSSRQGEATGEEERWPSDEDDTGLEHNALGLSDLTQLYPRAKLGLCNSPVK